MNLFVIYIGGKHEQGTIELHDMRFVIANTIEETYDALRQSWWGTPDSLHLDAWGILHSADGYDVYISDQPSEATTEKLYFVNLGGYDSKQFTELHENVFVVAQNDAEAKQKAVQQVQHWQVPHRDNLFEVENIMHLNDFVAQDKKYYVRLKKSLAPKPFEFTCLYTPIGEPRSHF
ncbi:MAG: DUF1543 domain-containing protein [Pseudomonadota bacterium]